MAKKEISLTNFKKFNFALCPDCEFNEGDLCCDPAGDGMIYQIYDIATKKACPEFKLAQAKKIIVELKK